VRDVAGVEWGVFALMGGEEKPQRYTHRHHYIFFVVPDRTCFALGDEYTVPLTRVPEAEGSTVHVSRGNYYGIENADAAAPVTLALYKAAHARRLPEQKSGSDVASSLK
jgi:hypothetical protein